MTPEEGEDPALSKRGSSSTSLLTENCCCCCCCSAVATAEGDCEGPSSPDSSPGSGGRRLSVSARSSRLGLLSLAAASFAAASVGMAGSCLRLLDPGGVVEEAGEQGLDLPPAASSRASSLDCREDCLLTWGLLGMAPVDRDGSAFFLASPPPDPELVVPPPLLLMWLTSERLGEGLLLLDRLPALVPVPPVPPSVLQLARLSLEPVVSPPPTSR